MASLIARISILDGNGNDAEYQQVAINREDTSLGRCALQGGEGEVALINASKKVIRYDCLKLAGQFGELASRMEKNRAFLGIYGGGETAAAEITDAGFSEYNLLNTAIVWLLTGRVPLQKDLDSLLVLLDSSYRVSF